MVQRRFFLCAFSALTLSGCTSLVSTNFDKQLGKENAQVVASQMGLYQADKMQSYVNQVGQRLVKELDNNEFTFQFHILDDATPNAFALPGGYIYISRGLLALLVTEDELACVLAHEISHVTQRHSVKQMNSSILPAIIELPGNVVGLFSQRLGNVINAPISTGNALILSGYSRSHETEADTLGVKLAAKAGYQPQSMSFILTRLNAAVEFTEQKKQQKSYFASHPYTPDRVNNINNLTKNLHPQFRDRVDINFPQILDGLVYGDNPANGIFKENLFLHPTMDFALSFPKQWQLYNQPQAVAAINEKEQAMFVLTGVDNKDNALTNANAFQASLHKQLGDKAPSYETIPLSWGGTAYYVSIQDKRQKPVATVQLMWVDLEDLTLQISAVSPAQYVDSLKEHALSFRPINQQEKQSINEQVLHIVKAQAGQDVKLLSEQQGSSVKLEYTELINDINEQGRIEKAQRIKIITEQPFVEGLSNTP